MANLSSDLRKSKRIIIKNKKVIIIGIIAIFFLFNYLQNNSAEFAREISAASINVASRAGAETASRNNALLLALPGILMVAAFLLPFIAGIAKYLGIMILGIAAIFMFGFDLVKTMVIIAVMIMLFNMVKSNDEL